MNDSPGAGVDEHTCQFLSMICIRCCPVRSVELLKNPGLPVSACIASCAACRFLPRRSGITHDCASGGGAGTSGVADPEADGTARLDDAAVSWTVTVAGAGALPLPHPVNNGNGRCEYAKSKGSGLSSSVHKSP